VSWSNPISQIQQTANQSSTVTGIGSGVYTASVTDSYGCFASMPVSISQPPLLLLNTPSTQTICYGSSAQVYAQGQGGTNTYTYTWSNGFVGSGPHVVNTFSNVSYTVTATDGNGCSSSPKIIRVAVSPSLSVVGTSLTVCDTKSIVLTPAISSLGNGGPYSYVWSNGQTTPSINVIGNSSISPSLYTVTIDDGCTIPGASAVFTVYANPLPVASFSADVLNGCAPLVITLTTTSNNSSDNFYWYEYGLSGNPVQINGSASGMYDVAVLVTNPSTSCQLEIRKSNYIELYPQPIASFYADPLSTSILDPLINFTNTSQGATTYLWDFGEPLAPNGTNTSYLINPSHSYETTGIYNVHLVAFSNKGCRDTAMVSVEVKPEFALYIPNAFTPDGNGLNDYFFPMGVGIDEDRYRLDIYDRWGENIFTSNNFRKGWDGSVKGGKIAPQGVYVYKLMVYDLQGNKHPFVGHVTVIRKDE
jgi:gliding motility-associated-like protein